MLLLAPSVSGLFKWRQFEPEVILLAVGWYLRFSLSYRDVEELLGERGLSVDHVTVWRWVQRYAPEIERRRRPHLVDPMNSSPSGTPSKIAIHLSSSDLGGTISRISLGKGFKNMRGLNRSMRLSKPSAQGAWVGCIAPATRA